MRPKTFKKPSVNIDHVYLTYLPVKSLYLPLHNAKK